MRDDRAPNDSEDIELVPAGDLPDGVVGGFKKESTGIPGTKDGDDRWIDICPTLVGAVVASNVRIAKCMACGALCTQSLRARPDYQIICWDCADRYIPEWREALKRSAEL